MSLLWDAAAAGRRNRIVVPMQILSEHPVAVLVAPMAIAYAWAVAPLAGWTFFERPHHARPSRSGAAAMGPDDTLWAHVPWDALVVGRWFYASPPTEAVQFLH